MDGKGLVQWCLFDERYKIKNLIGDKGRRNSIGGTVSLMNLELKRYKH